MQREKAVAALAATCLLMMASCSNVVPKAVALGDSTSSQDSGLGVQPSGAVVAPADSSGSLSQVPAVLVGRWVLTEQKCDEDSEEEPSADLPQMWLIVGSDFRYSLSIAGRPAVGTIKVERFQGDDLRLQLADSLLNFTLVADRLENWSEGDAVYQCGNILTRAAG